MAHGAVDGREPPSVVQVTVVPGPRRGIAPACARGLPRRGVASLIVAGAAACALLAGGGIAMFRGATAPGAAAPPTAGVRTAVAVDAVPLAAAPPTYRFPLGCLRITRTRQALAGAIRRRSDPCWRYGVYVTAILRRVGGKWRLALEASSRSCPRTALPGPLPGQLTVCQH